MPKLQRSALLALATVLLALPGHAEDPDLESLRKVYDRYGLPHPPGGARLVFYRSNNCGRSFGGTRLAFELRRDESRKAGLEYLDATEVTVPYVGKDATVSPVDAAALRATVDDFDEGREPLLLVAIQLHARGADDLAKDIWELAEAHDADREPPDATVEGPPAPFNPDAEVVMAAWNHWEISLTMPGTDRSVALEHLKQVLEDDPSLHNESRDALIHALALTVVPVQAKPGSPDALIEALVEVGASPYTDVMARDEDEFLMALAERGFTAVPALIRHYDDERLTRRWRPAGMSSHGSITTVGDLVRHHLWCLSCRQIRDFAGSREAVEDWWAEAQKQDEGDYLVKWALTKPSGYGTNIPNRIALKAIAGRFPKRLPQVYRTMLETQPDQSTWDLAMMVANCDLPVSERVEVLAEGSKATGEQHWTSACRALMTISPARCSECIFSRLGEVRSAESSKEQGALCCDVGFICVDIDREDVWDEFAKTARQILPDSRVTLLYAYLSNDLEAVKKGHYLQVIRSFLQDRDLTNRASDGTAFVPGNQGWRMRVCDSLAESVAWNTGAGDLIPGPGGAEAEWDAFVRAIASRIDEPER